MHDVRIAGATHAGLHVTDDSGTEAPKLDHPVDILLSGRHPQVDLNAEGHADTMMTGGEIQHLHGRLVHRPEEEGFSGYSAGPSRECDCGFNAYPWQEWCPRCRRRLRP